MLVAHPRSRGENEACAFLSVGEEGSSPLTRGKPHRTTQRGSRGRLIPAHAGKTLPMAAWVSSRAAHPRSRGENMVTAYNTRTHVGSSPLTRGKLAAIKAAQQAARLIPAHAGKTQRESSPGRRPAAHPRSRGENGYLSVFRVTGLGSSPLTRGKPVIHDRGCVERRLIPAHAGKTPPPAGKAGTRWAHPRSRGENGDRLHERHDLRGSSPLTRGKPARWS